ncbi:MAG: imidazolonepropionase [Thermoplasmata archaeon]|nr:imidazolonepropionase [Thermoplasmata archaeon]
MLPRELTARPRPARGRDAEGIVIRNAEQVVTLSPDRGRPLRGAEMRELGIQTDASVLIAGGRIQRIGEYEDLTRGRSERDYEVIDAAGKIVMPGFVDPHTHLVFAGQRANELSWKVEGASYLEIAKRGGGIQRTVRETRAASESELFDQASRRLDQMLLNGTTTLEAKSGYGLTTDDEIKMLTVAANLDERHPVDIVRTFLGAHAIPEEFAEDREGYLSLLEEEMIPAAARGGLVEFCDVFCEEGYFTPEESKRILEKGQTFGLKSKIHADEFTSSGGARVAAEVGAITADHLLQTSEEDMMRMAESGVVAVLLPAVPLLSMEESFANARKMIEMEIPVAIASDLNPNCWVTSMQTVISLACYKMRMTPEEAIVASTINAAYAVGRGEKMGSLDVGKVADLLVLDVPDYLHVPYMFDWNCVEIVIKSGEIIHKRES